jgi:hypothetical protein
MNSGDRQPSTLDSRHQPNSPAALEPQPRRCSSVVAATGHPCEAAPLTGSDRCWQHSENTDVAERRHLARVAGGMRKSKALKAALAHALPPADLATAQGIRAMLQSTADAVRAGQNSPSVANALSQLASVSLRLVELTLDVQELELTRQVIQDEPRPVGGRDVVR